ncbi:hypothetical protein [uncultured Corynebacterium sp.]|uniref:hypothetical protein n=1 Tax=uncultured Corynebacterium sp. TaxID=159447 RepID=UPI00261F2254|nr:hypothetical protein [uncultured Corynebacterium sp.]
MKITIPGLGQYDITQVAGAVLGVITLISTIVGISVAATQPAPEKETTCNWAGNDLPLIDGTDNQLLADSDATVKLTDLKLEDTYLDASDCPKSYISGGQGNPSITVTATRDSRLYFHLGYDDSRTDGGRTKAPYLVTISRPGQEPGTREMGNILGGQLWTVKLNANEPTTITVTPKAGNAPVYGGLVFGSPIIAVEPKVDPDAEQGSSGSSDDAK